MPSAPVAVMPFGPNVTILSAPVAVMPERPVNWTPSAPVAVIPFDPTTEIPAKIGAAVRNKTNKSATALRQRFDRLGRNRRDLSKPSPQSGFSAQHAKGLARGDDLANAGAPMLFGIRAASVGRQRQPSAPFSISACIALYSSCTGPALCCARLVFFRKNPDVLFSLDQTILDRFAWFRDLALHQVHAPTNVLELQT